MGTLELGYHESNANLPNTAAGSILKKRWEKSFEQ
jgi:hypothetical protein